MFNMYEPIDVFGPDSSLPVTATSLPWGPRPSRPPIAEIAAAWMVPVLLLIILIVFS